MITDLRKADLVAWEADKLTTPGEVALVLCINNPDLSSLQNEKYARVMWNTGNISNVPLKLIYLVNRSKV
jgi:hypothetical protein